MKTGYMNDKLDDAGVKLAERISEDVIGEIGERGISKDEIAGIVGKSVSFVYKVSQKRLSFDFDDLAKIGAETDVPVLKIITDIYSQIPDLTSEEKDANDEMARFDSDIDRNIAEVQSLGFAVAGESGVVEAAKVDWEDVASSESADDDVVNAGIAALMNNLLNLSSKDKVEFLKGLKQSKKLNGYLKKKTS